MAEAPPRHQMAENEMAEAPLLTFEELKTYFCHSGKYGEPGPKWPNETIICYQVFRKPAEENQAQQADDDQLAAQFEQLNVNPKWYRVDNTSTAHAEEIMKEKLKRRQEFQALGENDTLRIRMVVSFSPCNDCSDLLLNFKNDIEAKGAHVEINIKIANFFLHKVHARGLCKLELEGGFDLTVFEGEADWKKFYTDVTGKEIPEPCTDRARLEREKEDQKILFRIKNKRTGSEVMKT